MTATLKRSPSRKQGHLEGPRPLTRQEMESLRQDARETQAWTQEALKKMNIKPPK